MRQILDSCCTYFLSNPYDTWFKKLDQVVSGANASFYNASCSACHLDLIPYATERKWTELKAEQRSSLLGLSSDTLGLLLRDSSIRVVILNGKSVVERFQEIAGVCLDQREMAGWALPRKAGPDVKGVAYRGTIRSLSGFSLKQEVLVLGYNHNLQSSFGVTSSVVEAIRDWIADAMHEAVA